MAEPKTNAVTPQDFALFKQEMKHEFQLFQRDIKDSIIEVIDNKFRERTRLEVGLITIFVIAFFTYFEYTHSAIERVNNDRMARLEDALLASMNQKLIGSQDKKDNKRVMPASVRKTKVRK